MPQASEPPSTVAHGIGASASAPVVDGNALPPTAPLGPSAEELSPGLPGGARAAAELAAPESPATAPDAVVAETLGHAAPPTAAVTPPPLPSPSAGVKGPSPWWIKPGDQTVLAVCVAGCLVLMAFYQLRLSGWGRAPIELRQLPISALDYRIDVNQAEWPQWVQLPGIGRTLAEAIVADRQRNGPFRSIEDVTRVKGIGPKTVERLRPYLWVTPAPGGGSRPPP